MGVRREEWNFSSGQLCIKVKLSLRLMKYYTMKTLGSGGTAPPFLTPAVMKVSSLLRARPLYPRRKSLLIEVRRLSGPQSRSDRGGVIF